MNQTSFRTAQPTLGYQTQTLPNPDLPTTFGPDHNDCVHSAGQLEGMARKQLAPFRTRLVLAWVAAVTATLAMGAAMYIVLDGVLGWPTTMAVVMALVIQGMAIGLCHMWLHGLWSWDSDTFESEQPWNWKFYILVCVALFMIVMAYLRAKLFLEDMELSAFMTAVCSLIIALIDPLVTLAAGALTAVATGAMRYPQDLVRRAYAHRAAVAGVRGNVWPKSLQQAEQELNQLSGRHLGHDTAIARRNRQAKHVENWYHLLEMFDPVGGD